MGKRIVLYSLIVSLIFVFNITAFALDNSELDLSRKGSVSVTMRDSMTQDTVSGGSLSIYKVADVVVENGNSFYKYTDKFSECIWSLEDLENSELASNLSAYVAENEVGGATSLIDEKGIGRFEELDLGLYLVVQTTPSEGYFSLNPFLVSVPIIENDEFVYDVDATSKAEGLTQVPSTDEPKPTPVTTRRPGTLEQTGQLNWPVPVLIIAGLMFFALGWSLFLSQKRRKNNEA